MSNRPLKVAEAIQQVLGEVLEKQVQDPRLELVTFTHVDITPDLKHATVYWTTIKSSPKQVQKGLEKAKRLLRGEIGRKIRLKFTPELDFRKDETFEQGLRIEALLKKLKK